MHSSHAYLKGFVPYALAAFLIGIVGGFSTVLPPAFVQDLGIDYNNAAWTTLAQAMSTAACAPILGKLGDVFGRKITLLTGMALFSLGNVLSVLANSLAFMLLARFVVGVGTAAMAPVILAYIVTEFPQDQAAKGFSFYMLLSSASVVAGPTLGGLIIASRGWRAMLWICTAICAVVFALCLVTGQRAQLQRQRLQQFDTIGSVLVLIFFSLMLCVPSFGQNFGWTSPVFLGVLLAGAVSLAALVSAERRAVRPILSGRFMRRRVFVLSVLALFLTQGLMQANMTNIIVFVNYTQPDNAVISGYSISVMYLGMALGSILLGPLADRHDPRRILAGSLVLMGLGCGSLFFFSAATPVLLMMASLGILGIGLGGSSAIFMKVALSGLSPQQAGAGTGTYGLFRDLSAPFGAAVFVPLFANQITGLITGGMSQSAAAVRALHTLAAAELLCVAAGIAVVFLLPNYQTREDHT